MTKRGKYIFQILILCTADTHFIAGKQETLIHCISNVFIECLLFFPCISFAFCFRFHFLRFHTKIRFHTIRLGLVCFGSVRCGMVFVLPTFLFLLTRKLFLSMTIFSVLWYLSLCLCLCLVVQKFVVE